MNPLVIILLLSVLSAEDKGSNVSAAVGLPTCPEGLQPTEAPAPSLAGTHHLVFEGSAVLEAWVKPSGELENVSMVSSEWNFIRGGGTEVVDRLIVNGIGKWRYPVVAEKCVVRIAFKAAFAD